MDGRASLMDVSSGTAMVPAPSRGSLVLRMGAMLVVVAAIGAGVVGYKMMGATARQQAMRAQAGAPQVVSASLATSQSWTPEMDAVGSLKAVNGADLSLEVSGIVDEIMFNSGDDVHAGDLLLRLRGQDEQAKLQSLEAVARLARITYDRNLELSKSQNVSRATLDANDASLKNALAQVEQQQAVIDKKTVRAPFAGHLGVRTVDRGQYLNAGTTVVTLQALDPIYLDFFMPQQSLDRVKVGQPVDAKVDTYPDAAFKGTITAINPKVDAANRNVLVRATLKNPDRRLIPGMYATVKVAAGESVSRVVVPQTAISYSPYGDSVYILDKKAGADGKEALIARYEFVTLGETRGDMVSVLSGVKEGDMVVSAGGIKLRNGAPARIDNAVQPATDISPKPANP